MTATMRKANDVKGYFMTDSSTWVAEKKSLPNLTVLFRGDPVLINTYHTLCQPEGATRGQKTAVRFIDFVASAEGQSSSRTTARNATARHCTTMPLTPGSLPSESGCRRRWTALATMIACAGVAV